ncbi:MAG: hypothetical protein H6500_00235 [Candidatus Woesearchaeota archaeon]|nr:MAG: hypothetical protein H6500_00235 [Candidatus Woesearchaeota archaeon]
MKKLFHALVFVISFFFGISSVLASCSFTDNSDECPRFSSSFLEVSLAGVQSSGVGSVEAFLSNKLNPNNKIPLSYENGKLKNTQALTESGVYVLEVTVLDAAGNKLTTLEKELIFDSLEPAPPLLSLLTQTTAEKVTLYGHTQIPKTKVKVDSGSTKDIISDESGNFSVQISLKTGVNYVKAYTVNDEGQTSALVERIILRSAEDLKVRPASQVTSISLEAFSGNNERTEGAVTTKQNLFVKGKASGSDGSVVYVNGQPALVVGGQFAAFVLLNEGENTIVAESRVGDARAEKDITYVKPRFLFLSQDYDKVVSSSSPTFSGTTNLDLPFYAYVNGKLLGTITPKDGKYSFSLKGLQAGKNTLLLEGLTHQEFYDLLYYDTQSPSVELKSASVLAQDSELTFLITDDIGVDLSKLKVKVDSTSYGYGDLTRRGDYYSLNLSDVSDGTHSYSVQVEDYVGKTASNSGQVSVGSSSSQEDLLQSFEFDSGEVIGNEMFISPTTSYLSIQASEFVAFESIFIDEVRHSDYLIYADKHIELKNLEFLHANGSVEFVYIDADHKKYTRSFLYHKTEGSSVSDLGIQLDYVRQHAASTVGGAALVTGTINGSFVNWGEVSFNSIDTFKRYGNNFEVAIPLEQGKQNLRIHLADYAGSDETVTVGSLLYGDASSPELQGSSSQHVPHLDSVENESFEITLEESPSTPYFYFASSYDGVDFMGASYLEKDTLLPVQQRQGLRALQLSGKETSRRVFDSGMYLKSLDSEVPQAFLVKNGGVYQLIIDPTLSVLDEDSISISVDGVNSTAFSKCDDTYALNSVCLENFGNVRSVSQIKLFVRDVAGNVLARVFRASEAVEKSSALQSESVPLLYFTGNDRQTSRANYFVQGQFTAESAPEKVSTGDGTECFFDDYNFVCPVKLKGGQNVITVIVETVTGQKGSASFEIELISDIDLSFDSLDGESLYHFGDAYYLDASALGKLLQANGQVSPESQISLLIGSQEIAYGKRNGSFSLDLNLDPYLQEEEAELALRLKAEDEQNPQNVVFSEVVKVFYSRALQAIVDVIVR